jgi:hypothetical protein
MVEVIGVPYKDNTKGYWRIKINGKRIQYSRYLIEQKLGRKLNKYELVHHRDENVDNNSLDNLEVKWHWDHTTDHHLGKKRSEISKANISASRKGKEKTSEHKENLSKAVKEYYKYRKIALLKLKNRSL